MSGSYMAGERKKLTWQMVYSENELHKAAIRLYTKPLFNTRKAFSTSHDNKTLYDFARHGLKNLYHLHRELAAETFAFRHCSAVHHNFNGKHRTLYIFPWEERLVDLLLYRILNQRFNHLFLPCAYAYRIGVGGVDACQHRVANYIRSSEQELYVIKRDITNYFDSVNHEVLINKLAQYIDPDNYLFKLLVQRVKFQYLDSGEHLTAEMGIPFGTAIACLFANIYLHDLDTKLYRLPDSHVYRYADDILFLARDRDIAVTATEIINGELNALKLASKASHELNLVLNGDKLQDPSFDASRHFRHLGLEFWGDGLIRLSRDKGRKIRNLFRYSLRRNKGKFKRIKNPQKRAKFAIELIGEVTNQRIRNVAIIDYYLKHVQDEKQIRELDLWLAEKVLAIAFQNGHKKGNFRKISFRKLREWGLTSLVHRQRQLLHRHLNSSFFAWINQNANRYSGKKMARAESQPSSPIPEAAAST